MRPLHASVAFALCFCAAPALASQDKPLTDGDPGVIDVAKTPVTDLNFDKQEIPQELISAQREPYALDGIGNCKRLIATVERLDEMLGPDIDLPQEARDRISAGRVAQKVVGSFIPFRGLIREVSGANEHERKVRAAIQAGLARRGFLKGIGIARGCSYPGRPATRQVIASYLAKQKAEKEDKDKDKKKDESDDKTQFTSQPVVQETK